MNKDLMRGVYQRVLGAMSGLANVDVEIVKNVTPHFSPKENVIRMPDKIVYADTEDEEFKFGRGVMIHETSHVLFCPRIADKWYRDAAAIGDGLDFADILNVFADCNNEFRVTKVFPHLKESLAAKTMALIKKRPEILEHENPFLQLLLRCDRLIQVSPKYPQGYPKEIINFIDATVKEFDAQKIHETTGRKMVQFSWDVFKVWAALKKKHASYMGNNLVWASTADGSIEQLKKDLSKAIMDGNEAEEERIRKEIDKISSSTYRFKNNGKYESLNDIPTDHAGKLSEKTAKELEKLAESLKDQEKIKSGGKEGYQPKGRMETHKIPPEWKQIEDADMNLAFKEGMKLRSYLLKRVKLQQDYETKHNSGVIDLSEVRSHIGRVGRLCSPNLFTRPFTLQRGGDWAVDVVIDVSSSMGGDRIADAKTALAMLGYAFKGVPGIRLGITAFTSESEPIQYIVKGFTQKFDISEIKKLRPIGGTPTDLAIMNSLSRLSNVPMRRVMIVITDGYPGDIEAANKALIDCKKYDTEAIGIFIGCDFGDNMQFKHSYAFQSTEGIYKALADIILKAIKARR